MDRTVLVTGQEGKLPRVRTTRREKLTEILKGGAGLGGDRRVLKVLSVVRSCSFVELHGSLKEIWIEY